MYGRAIGIAVALVVIVGPLLLALGGAAHARRVSVPTSSRLPWNWKLTVNSTLLYTLAFNLTFFIQELFLVLPKALTPGLRPTLFHNNHSWEGEHPLARLFQGTGALATLIVAGLCVWLLKRGRSGSTAQRLFLVWMAYCGFFMALPQVAIGALSSGSDLGMAMEYLRLGPTAKLAAALVALAAIPPLALGLARPLLALAEQSERIADTGARTRFAFLIATVPVLVGTVLIIPFRMPREWIEVVLLPVWVAVFGIVWIQAGAWRMRGVQAAGSWRAGSTGLLFVATLALLLLFQLVLRPGIAFY